MAARYSNNIMFSKGLNTPIESAQDGLWSDPATWVGGKVPLGGRRAVILNHNVGYDVNITRVLTLTKGVNGSLLRDYTLPPNLAAISAAIASQLAPLLSVANATQEQVGNLPAPLNSLETAQSVWNVQATDYNISGTMGEAAQAGGGSAPTVEEIAAEIERNGGMVDELHKLQGLSLGNPMTVTPTARTVTGITLNLTGDGVSSTTVTRA